jgi:hypothetical protein
MVVSPAGTPGAIVTKLRRGTMRLRDKPDVSSRIAGFGVESVGSTPAAPTALHCGTR